MPGGSDLPEAIIFRKISGVIGFTGSGFFSLSAITGNPFSIGFEPGDFVSLATLHLKHSQAIQELQF